MNLHLIGPLEGQYSKDYSRFVSTRIAAFGAVVCSHASSLGKAAIGLDGMRPPRSVLLVRPRRCDRRAVAMGNEHGHAIS